MDEKFVIVEVLTSTDYFQVAQLLAEKAEAADEEADGNELNGWDESARDCRDAARELRARAARFARVGEQVREQEAKTHGL